MMTREEFYRQLWELINAERFKAASAFAAEHIDTVDLTYEDRLDLHKSLGEFLAMAAMAEELEDEDPE